ncbi:MAG: DNA mismatch repair endonuclease MutL [Lachnospiraceae bacterium]|nr:DNA mismatch repair endonuclease MutL [Lachnospiraceae bacterium]
MPEINLLEQNTIDQIAAGEVVERPVSVVKELVENAIDAGATQITVEIKEGGTSLIRVTDNGSGIERSQLKKAFLRHATSKIRNADDLANILSLGFRGEALSSIAAVSRMEVITKTANDLTGIQYILTPGEEGVENEIGAPNGSTFLVRNLFFNVPVRRKFLKKPQTEGSYITDLMERLALSRPDISFKYINYGTPRFHTSGRGNIHEVIYRLFGRDIADSIIPISAADTDLGLRISGFLGRPNLNRANRNFEFFFINGRYVTSDVLKTGLEDGYHPYVMQHKFPFAVLSVNINSDKIDVNVHPGKMEVRLNNEKEIILFIAESVKKTLDDYEHIMTESVNKTKPPTVSKGTPEPFEVERIRSLRGMTHDLVVNENPEYKLQDNMSELHDNSVNMQESLQKNDFIRLYQPPLTMPDPSPKEQSPKIIKYDDNIFAKQLNLFEEKFLSAEAKGNYEILGQIFGVYWLISMGEQLIFIDQHAAHEKVKYERLLAELKERKISSQNLNPPIMLELSVLEEDILVSYQETLSSFGFEIEHFGAASYALRAVPNELYGLTGKEFFREIFDELSEMTGKEVADVVERKVAGAACKAAVKANMRISKEELEALIDELIELDNPYFCPHGRPTIVSMGKREIEKKFKRVT